MLITKTLMLINFIKNIFSRPQLLITLIYIFSRLYLHVFLNIEFSYHLKDYLIQYLDITLLKQNIFESIIFLHSQPPLFNLIIGLAEIFFGNYANIIFFILFHLMSLTTAILSFKLLITIGVNKNLSLIIILLYILTPATILYENLFFYTQPIIFFLTYAGYNLVVFVEKKQIGNFAHYLSGLCLTVLTTSFFHIGWYLFLIFITWFFINSSTLKLSTIKIAILPFLIILTVYLKNFILFGNFETSSWLGMNLSRITVEQLDYNLKTDLIKQKKLSEISKFPAFMHYSDISTINKEFFNENTGIDVLDENVKKSGRTNFNNLGYIKISNLALTDALFVIKNYPQIYLSGVIKAFTRYYDSPTKYKLLASNQIKIWYYNNFFDAFIYGASRKTATGYLSILFNNLIFFASLFLLKKRKINSKVRTFIIFALINIFYVFVIGNFLEYGENNRFRYYTEIFNYLLMGILINELLFKSFINKINRKSFQQHYKKILHR